MSRSLRALLVLWASIVAGHTIAQDAPKFRTDESSDKGLKWFQLSDGKFPPAGSAHAVTGELIKVDHLERRLQLRVDRDDSQQRSHWDLPLEATMLPYGSIYYHGVPAALQDIPLGTHMHGLFYLKDPQDKTPDPPGPHNRVTPDVDFKRCFQLEDDFSFHARRGEIWKIDSVDLSRMKVSATLTCEGKAVGASKMFDLLTSTRVYSGSGFGNLASIEAGQLVQFNLTWATLYGPGRILEMWLDEPSRELAKAQQLERHRNHIRERGLAGWVEAVDDEQEIVTITFFGGVDPALFDELNGTSPDSLGWPLSREPQNPLAPKGTIAVARESLMTYDPVNDRKGGNILSVSKIPIEPGSSGVQIRVKSDVLLEGFRPRRIVRFYPARWKVNALPREEQFTGRD